MQKDHEQALSPAESRDLRCIAGMMIPASEEFDIPGADDPIIFADILRSLDRDLDDVRAALAVIAGGAPAGLTEAQLVSALTPGSRATAALGRAVLQCYYRDDRVLTALGLQPRAPFPEGYTLEQGDWSLLDAVRDRPQLWRDDRGA